MPSRVHYRERRDLYPEGVASGDPDEHSVLLWTRRPFDDGRLVARLNVELAEDDRFQKVVARARAKVSAASDWTCRVLVGGLLPAREYWYRFVDADGFGGHTPLFGCVVSQAYLCGRQQDAEFARVLLDHGADPNAHASLRKRLRFVADETEEDQAASTEEVKERHEKLSDDVDAILDEIDEVLEENAEEFVRSYVQKGGQ